jgi:hypothetical protein
LTTYRTAVKRTVDWLVETRPPAPEHMANAFDYAAEDEFLRSLS